jgi:hypothetical protein
MKTRVLLFIIFAVSVFAFGTLVTTLFNTAPIENEVIVMFYLALFVALFGLTFFITYGFYYLRLQATPNWQSTLFALRLGTIAGLLAVILLAIQSVNLLNAATFIILLVLSVVAELIMRRRTASS